MNKFKTITFFLLFLITFSSLIFWFRNQNGQKVVMQEVPTRIETNIESRVTQLAESKEPICENNCKENCEYFPLGKNRNLDSSYIPTDLQSGRIAGVTMRMDAYEELINLINDAKSQGVKIKVQSSYRSYQTQQSVFNSYVNNEMAANRNLTRVQAEEKANVYSARPGHSEHQLGTTADLTCVGCTAFKSDANNQKVYDYIKSNAYKFGFVVSYPKDTTDKTGYKFEPWHIRFVGKNFAAEYQKQFDVDNLYTLQEFLESKCNVQ